jgi:hypothetical protein
MSIFEKTNSDQDNDNSADPVPSLADCAPTDCTPDSMTHTSSMGIWRPGQDSIFTTVGDPMTIACIIERLHDPWGNYTGETYYPVPEPFQGRIGLPIRPIAFRPGVTAASIKFIYPQKLDPPHSRVNTWNASLAEALAHPPDQWRRIWSDSDAQRYQHELVSPPMEEIPEYPDFREDLEKALSPNIITSANHPVVQRLLGKQGPKADMEEVY